MDLKGIIKFNYEELSYAEELFHKYSRINLSKISKIYEKAVLESRKYIISNCNVNAVIKCIHIKEKSNDSIILESGHVLSGTMIAEKLRDSHKVYLYVVTLKNFTEAVKSCKEDMMESFCLDTWANAFIESAQMVLREKIEKEIINEEIKGIWCPGENDFYIENQIPVFDILKPEIIGVELTETYLMKPVKTGSYVMGVGNKTC